MEMCRTPYVLNECSNTVLLLQLHAFLQDH